MRSKLPHRPEHSDAARHATLFAEAPEGRRHRRRVGVVAFVDQQHLATVHRDDVALTPALQASKVGEG